MSRTNEPKHIQWNKTCKCKCRLYASVFNNKESLNKYRCRCEYKDLIKGICDKGFNRNFTNCNCECDKSCNVGEYLNHENYECRNQLFDKLVKECNGNIDENEMIYNKTLNYYKNIYISCTIYIVLLVIAFFLIISISSVFTYFHLYLKSDINISNNNPDTVKLIYETYKWEISNKLLLKNERVTFLLT